VIVGQTEAANGFYLGWDELRRMADSGRWNIQEHAGVGHVNVQIDAAGHIGPAYAYKRYLGDGKHAWLNGESIRTSTCVSLGEARLSTTDPFLFRGSEADGFARLRGALRVARYGHDAYGYARLAAGTVDLVAESGLKPHDYNALVPVIRGAGGIIGNWRGGADLSAGQVLAAATPELFDQAVASLAQP